MNRKEQEEIGEGSDRQKQKKDLENPDLFI